MGVLGSILGNAVNSAFSGLNAETSYHYNLKLQKAVNSNRHQWEVSDLRKAGLNPILSATNGMGYANAGGVSIASSDSGLGSAETSSNTAFKVQKMQNDNSLEITDRNNKTSRDIADQSNDTQERFNQGQLDIGRTNAFSGLMNAVSNSSYYRAMTLSTLAAIDRADRVAESEINRNNSIGAGALMSGQAAVDNANTGKSRMLAQNSVDKEVERGHRIKNDWDEKHPYSNERLSSAFQFFDWGMDQFQKAGSIISKTK